MFNDHLSNEMAKEYIDRREQEVEAYSFQSRLGYKDNRAVRWIFVLLVVVAVLALMMMF